MLLSLEKNFIFIHIPKTAGTSITRVLRPWCLTPKPTPWRRSLSRLPVLEAPEKVNFKQHDKAAWLRRKLPTQFYDSAYKFAVVRNPFELVVSNYQHLRRKTSRRRHRQAQRWDFKAFLRYLERKNRARRSDELDFGQGRKAHHRRGPAVRNTGRTVQCSGRAARPSRRASQIECRRTGRLSRRL
jgi:hypothetical protein